MFLIRVEQSLFIFLDVKITSNYLKWCFISYTRNYISSVPKAKLSGRKNCLIVEGGKVEAGPATTKLERLIQKRNNLTLNFLNWMFVDNFVIND